MSPKISFRVMKILKPRIWISQKKRKRFRPYPIFWVIRTSNRVSNKGIPENDSRKYNSNGDSVD